MHCPVSPRTFVADEQQIVELRQRVRVLSEELVAHDQHAVVLASAHHEVAHQRLLIVRVETERQRTSFT